MEGDAGGNVGFNDPGDDCSTWGLGGDDEVNAGGAGFGGEKGDSVFYIGRSDLHEVRQLVDDDHDVGKAIRERFFGGGGRSCFPVFQLRGEIKLLDAVGNADSSIIGGDVSDAGFCHIAVPLFHFDGDPAKSEENFFRFGDDGDDEVGETIVNLKLDDLGIDQDEAEIVGAKSVEEAEEESVDADRFARSGSAGDEGVREIGQVVDQGRPVDVLSEGNRKMGGGGVPLGTFDEIAEEDFDFRGVGDLDGDRVATGDGGENVDAFCFHGAGKIAFEITDSFHADAGGGVEFVASDGGAAGDVAGADLDIEVGEGLDDSLLVRF